MFQPCQRQWLPVSNLAIVNQARNRVLSFSVLLVTMCVDLANSHSDSSFCLSYAGLDNCQGLHKLTGLDIRQGLHKLAGGILILLFSETYIRDCAVFRTPPR